MGPADGLLVVGSDGCIWVYNRPAEELLGLPEGCLAVGVPLRQVVPLPALLAAVEARLHGTAPVREQVIEIGPQQSIYADVAPLPAGDGGIDSVLVVLRDTREIERLQSMRRDFIANVSHEMRTPLAAIRGCSATLLAGALSDHERARHFVEVIEQHAVRLGHLLDDLACLADLEHGRVELHRRPLAVAPAVESAVSVCRDQALAAGIALASSVDSDTPLLDGDRDLLDQVLVRLIDNALRYTPRGGRVSLSAAPTAAPSGDTGRWVRLAVVDTGVGIPAEDVPRLSERFYRPDKGRSRELGGSGLGLALVKHIVRAHGGVMEIASALQQGTTVALFWPSFTAAPESLAAQAQGGERR
jgi:two-component system phosphate regulon sensor histidine kinase PhoR